MRDYNKNYRSKKHSNANEGGDISAVTVNDKFAHIQPIQAKPLEVKVWSPNNFEKAIKAFRALVQKERVLSIYKEKQSYEKPSDKKRRKRAESERKQIELCSKGECIHEEHAKNRKVRRFRRDKE